MMAKRHKVYLIKKLPMRSSYFAICLFGFILSRRPLSSAELNHELIHVAQQKELLFLPFYIWYVMEWLVLYVKYRDWMTAYYHIRFEQEAYNHQDDMQYLKNRKHYRYK